MRRIIREGVKTRVLMLSATPVNNRLADLRNQIAFVTEGQDTALFDHGIASIDATTRLAQKQFNRWMAMDESERTPGTLVDMLGFDYFQLLDLLTIARSRKHIEKYYGTAETGKFPERLKPINIKPDVDRAGEFRSIREINNEIRRLNLATYAPLRYVLPHKQAAYDAKYSTELRGGEGFFRQVDREESLVHLLRVNVLKRMESAVLSLTLRPDAKTGRLVELIHRAIPYPLLLVTEQSDHHMTLSLAHKRWSQGETGKMVLDDAVALCDLVEHAATAAFLDSLSLAVQPRPHLLDLYQGWINCLDAFNAAQITGRFAPSNSSETAAARREALAEYDRLVRRITALRVQAEKEPQIGRRVDLNLEIKRLETELAESIKRME
jgi:hypothetical protein